MIDVTVDRDGMVRVHPESTASLRVTREPEGWITVINLDTRIVLLNGHLVARAGRETMLLLPGRRVNFPPVEVGAGVD